MAKTKKKVKAKTAKKAVSKKKKVAPKAKPVSKKKAVKKAPAKKTAPKKAIKKTIVLKKAAPKAAKAPKVKAIRKATKPARKTGGRTSRQRAFERPATPPMLTVFPALNQRPIAHKPKKSSAMPEDKTRYSDAELKEFESLILEKLESSREEFKILKETLNRNNDSGTDSTSGGNTKVLEDGAETAEKENLSQLAARQQKYIQNLENALVRIKNGTYGICSVTGKLISKDRLIAVPHTTQSIEAKMMQTD